jgi:hypothetical protein
MDFLEIHHIELFSQSQNDNDTNLITLCGVCHAFAPNTKEDFEKFIQLKENPLDNVKTFMSQNKYDEAWDILETAKEIEKERTREGIAAKKDKVAQGLDVWKGRGPDTKKRKTDGYKAEQERRRLLNAGQRKRTKEQAT